MDTFEVTTQYKRDLDLNGLRKFGHSLHLQQEIGP